MATINDNLNIRGMMANDNYRKQRSIKKTVTIRPDESKSRINDAMKNLANAIIADIANKSVTPNPMDPSRVLEMDLGDLGNLIGIHVQRMVNEGLGTMDEFANGWKHGKSLIDGTHDEPKPSKKSGMSSPSKEGAVAVPPKPKMEDYYDSSDPRGCSLSEYQAWQNDLKKWEARYGKNAKV